MVSELLKSISKTIYKRRLHMNTKTTNAQNKIYNKGVKTRNLDLEPFVELLEKINSMSNEN